MKNTSSKNILIPVFLCFCLLAGAQNVDQNVTVEREYKPVIQDAGKITTKPEVLEITVDKKQAAYTDFNFPLQVDQNLSVLSAAQLTREKRERLSSYVRAGIGNYWNTMADVALPIIKSSDTKLDFQLNHYGSFADSMAFSTTNADLLFDHYFDNLSLYAGVGVGHEYRTFYGTNYDKSGTTPVNLLNLATTMGATEYSEKDLVRVTRTALLFSLNDIAGLPKSDYVWKYNAYVGVKSLPDADGLRYDTRVKYDAFNSHNGLVENQLLTTASFDNENNENRIGIDVSLCNLFYSANNMDINFWDTYSVFSVNPYYKIERDNWKVRLGVKSSFSFIHGNPFNPAPDIYGELKAAPKWLALYAGITGAYDVNTLSSIYDENKYVYTDLRVKDTYTPFNTYFGVKVKPLFNLLIDAYVNYKYIDNQYFYVNKKYYAPSVADSILYTNRFNVAYSQATLLKIGARANYNIRNIVNVELKGAYNGWDVATEDYAWNKPKWEWSLNSDVRFTRNFNVSANLFYVGERFAKLGDTAVRMNPYADINLAASYSYTKQFTVFAKLNNILNTKYEMYYGYRVQGVNALVGVAYSFK